MRNVAGTVPPGQTERSFLRLSICQGCSQRPWGWWDLVLSSSRAERPQGGFGGKVRGLQGAVPPGKQSGQARKPLPGTDAAPQASAILHTFLDVCSEQLRSSAVAARWPGPLLSSPVP